VPKRLFKKKLGKNMAVLEKMWQKSVLRLNYSLRYFRMLSK
jgi:hypothetical protein